MYYVNGIDGCFRPLVITPPPVFTQIFCFTLVANVMLCM